MPDCQLPLVHAPEYVHHATDVTAHAAMALPSQLYVPRSTGVLQTADGQLSRSTLFQRMAWLFDGANLQ